MSLVDDNVLPCANRAQANEPNPAFRNRSILGLAGTVELSSTHTADMASERTIPSAFPSCGFPESCILPERGSNSPTQPAALGMGSGQIGVAGRGGCLGEDVNSDTGTIRARQSKSGED
jgi:hypothetical protein